jgi:DNA-binding IclR family transcriptional regulator
VAYTVTVQRRRPKFSKAGSGKAGADAYHSKAIVRALDVLECFTDDNAAFNLKEISGILKLPESSLFRVLLTLEAREYLIQDGSGCYRLSPRLLYGKLRERADRLTELVRPYLQELAARFDETSSLAYLFENRIQVLDSVNTLHEVRVINRPGRVLPPHCSSLGKAITAFQDRELMEQILETFGLSRRTPYTLMDRRAILAQLEEIRACGYAADRQESAEGGVCLGAAIRPEGKRVLAAISVSTPLARMTPEREKEITQRVVETAGRIARAISSTGN